MSRGSLDTLPTAKHRNLAILIMFLAVFQLAGCVSDKVDEQSVLTSYQQTLAAQGPQQRSDTEGSDSLQPLGLLKPTAPAAAAPDDANATDPDTDERTILEAEETPIQPSEPAASATEAPLGVAAVVDPNTGRKDILGSGLRPRVSMATAVPDVGAVPDPNTIGKSVPGPRHSETENAKSTPSPVAAVAEVEIVEDPNAGEETFSLTIEQALARTLANSPEIRVVSFDPSIAKQDITQAAAEFDITAFGRLDYVQDDNPQNSIFQAGQSDVRTAESGIKQKGASGSEWSLTYGLTRSWDDLFGRSLATRYEPVLGFQLRQPLLRDAGEEVTLAGVNIAKLNYKIALLGFREEAEETAVQVISAYWQLLQARRDREIHQELLERARDTLKKVEGRREIDATAIQIKQTEASTRTREATLLHVSKSVSDAQDVLVRLMADPQLNVLDEFHIVPISSVLLEPRKLERSEILELAMRNNPAIQQARTALDIAEINIRVAENQDMPRLDLIASARTQGLARGPDTAQDRLNTGDFASYAVGLSLEIPLGNRQRKAELLKRRLERRQAISAMQNVADQVAIAVKGGARRIETNYSEILVQEDAVEAAGIHLKALEDSEPIRERLTPEFLLVKLQAQEALANAQKAEIRSVVDFGISLAQLAQIQGRVFQLHQVRTVLPTVVDDNVTE